MSVSVTELNELLNDKNYARFIHTNLHLHTPVTGWDWNAYPDQTTKAEDITPEIYFNTLNQTSLELVAITDHNCVDWCESLIKLAREGRKAGTSRLHILPGVEITTYEGPHLIALFDENHPIDEITALLTRLKLSGKGIQTDRVDKKITITHILNEINDMEGIVLAPHIQSKDGLWGAKEFRGRTDILNDSRLRIAAAPSGDIKRVMDSGSYPRFLYKTMDSTLIHNSFSFINVSDCHRVDDFELNTTWLKMCTPSLEGVRQIIYEPELRICHEIVQIDKPVEFPYAMNFCSPKSPEHSHIIGLSVTGGMLDGERIAFSPHQNCIIGKNYAGKSAVLDCVRFALDILPANDEAEKAFISRLKAIVIEGGTVRLYCNDKQGKTYGISRTLLLTNTGSKNNPKWKLEGKPEIYYLLDEEFHHDSAKSAHSIFHAEVYPQGEVVRIKDNVSRQMEIVDSLARLHQTIEELKLEEKNGTTTLLGRLSENSQKIVEFTNQLNQINEQLQAQPDIEIEIEKLEKLADSPLLKEVQQWTEVSEKINQSRKKLEEVRDEISEFLTQKQTAIETINEPASNGKITDLDLETASPSEFINEIDCLFQQSSRMIADSLIQAQGVIKKNHQKLNSFEEIVNKRFGKVEEDVKAQSTNTNIDELTRLITEKKRRLNELQSLENDKSDIEDELDTIIASRQEMKTDYFQQWKDVREKRKQIVEVINQDSADNIEADLLEGDDITAYIDLLNEIAKRLSSATNRFSNYKQLEFIAENITPQELVVIICRGDANELLNAASGLSSNNARLLLGMGLEDTHKLELCVPDDKFEIRFRKEGDEHFTPIDGGLSGGEQALALISVAMIQKNRPLLIDQPEDELGPALITGELVEQIRKVKSKRQLLFVTHIPNIPVLADSEQILYVEQEISVDQKNTKLRYSGSLDNLQIVGKLLELDGGKVAFDKRQQRYTRIM